MSRHMLTLSSTAGAGKHSVLAIHSYQGTDSEDKHITKAQLQQPCPLQCPLHWLYLPQPFLLPSKGGCTIATHREPVCQVTSTRYLV